MDSRNNRKHGFTMAEMLIVVAIIGVLAAVSFVAVAQHQRSLERVERDSVAREIFVAAQNHLTMAQSQGYLGLGDKTGEVEDAGKGYYFFVVNQGDQFSKNITPETLIDLMLPLGAVDETVRGGGSYIIRYHPDTATVMDVFYCSNESTDSRFGHSLSKAEEDELVKISQEGDIRKRNNYNGAVLGWYGGEEPKTLPRITLEDPEIVVENGDKLRVGVVDKNTMIGSLQIIVTGVTSKVQKAFYLKSNDSGIASDEDRADSNKTVDGITCDYVRILDDITEADLHFADMKGIKAGVSTGFIPGEDITIQAIAYDNTQLSNIAYSAEITVNSLFEKLGKTLPDENNSKTMTASVNSIRHLENLDKRVSNVETDWEFTEENTKATYKLNNAIQSTDLNWTLFKGNTNGDSTVVYLYGEEAGTTETGCYLPVSPEDYVLSYDGQKHSVSNIQVNYAGDAGMFGKLEGTNAAPLEFKNLALIDFNITENGSSDVNAGTLAGSLKYVNVTNVIAYDKDASSKVNAKSGDAGGLIGSTNNCIVLKSAASVTVESSNASAGGLIGTATNGSVSACYSGGHTNNATYFEDNGTTITAIYNVTAAQNAGGLVGYVSSTDISSSYSTCSVTGETAGGFVAISSGSISNCYATGLVLGTGSESITNTVNETPTTVIVTKDGAFAYSLTGSITEKNYYYEIINEREDAEIGHKYLTALGKNGTNDKIIAFDDNAADYNNFVGDPSDWKSASAYDPKLIEYYSVYNNEEKVYIGRYNLRTVKDLGGDVQDTDFVSTHYGDWPAPEIFVINTAAS